MHTLIIGDLVTYNFILHNKVMITTQTLDKKNCIIINFIRQKNYIKIIFKIKNKLEAVYPFWTCPGNKILYIFGLVQLICRRGTYMIGDGKFTIRRPKINRRNIRLSYSYHS
jgi:hypothetical protein